MKILLVQEHTGATKSVKLGFCWTIFFFGLWVPLFRGDFKWFFILLLLWIFTGWFYFIIPGIGDIVMGFLYNRIYARELLEKGYVAATPWEHELLLRYL